MKQNVKKTKIEIEKSVTVAIRNLKAWKFKNRYADIPKIEIEKSVTVAVRNLKAWKFKNRYADILNK
jgi:hypothetical protein